MSLPAGVLRWCKGVVPGHVFLNNMTFSRDMNDKESAKTDMLGIRQDSRTQSHCTYNPWVSVPPSMAGFST